jgi:hypothetical protein
MKYTIWDRVVVTKKYKFEDKKRIGKKGTIIEIIGSKECPGGVYYRVRFKDNAVLDYLENMLSLKACKKNGE